MKLFSAIAAVMVFVSVLGAFTASSSVLLVQYVGVGVAAVAGWLLARRAAQSPILNELFVKVQKANLPPELETLTHQEEDSDSRKGFRHLISQINTVAHFLWTKHRKVTAIGGTFIALWFALQFVPGVAISGARGSLGITLFTFAGVVLVELMLSDSKPQQ